MPETPEEEADKYQQILKQLSFLEQKLATDTLTGSTATNTITTPTDAPSPASTDLGTGDISGMIKPIHDR